MSQTLQIHCEFPDTSRYRAKYQRNNKRTGLKNLRCYPFCGPDDKHHENGFCGAAMRINISSSQLVGTGTYSVDRMCAWGEFTSQAPGPSSPVRFPVGSVFSLEDISKIVRSDGAHLNPLFEASFNDAAFPRYRQFSFESQKKGWHYDWKGNKYTSDLPHAFTAYVAVPLVDHGSLFQCVGVFSSPLFTMFCRRRHKTVPEAEKTQMATPVEEEDLIARHQLVDSKIPIAPSNGSGAYGGGGVHHHHNGAAGALSSPPPPPPPQLPTSLPVPSSSAAPKTTVKKKRTSDAAATASTAPPRPRGEELPKKQARLTSPPQPLTPQLNYHHYVLPQLLSVHSPISSPMGTPVQQPLQQPYLDTHHLTENDKFLLILTAIQNLDKLRKIYSSKCSEEAAEDDALFESFESLDTNWIDNIFSGSFHDQGLIEDFNTSMRDVAMNDFLLNLGEGENLKRTISVIEGLGKHLVDEDTFTQAIHDNAKNGTMTFADCMRMILSEVQSFLLSQYGLTVDELYANLRGSSTASAVVDSNQVDAAEEKQAMESAFDKLVQAATTNFAKATASTSSEASSVTTPPIASTATATAAAAAATATSVNVSTPSQPTNFDIKFPPGVVLEDFLLPPKPNTSLQNFPEVTGWWIRPEANKVDMEKWRERRDMDWVSRQMIGKMESKFGMTSQPLTNSIGVHLSKKLLSTGEITYVLDAQERPFFMSGPLGPALAKTMIGWAVGPCAVFRNAYSDTERLIRANWRVGEDELHGVHIYQAKSEEGFRQAGGAAEASEFVSEDGWRVVHVAKYICTRDTSKE